MNAAFATHGSRLLPFLSALHPLMFARVQALPHVFLTIDDGPCGAQTESILRLLEDERIPAAFFLIGNKIETQPDIVRAIHRNGHAIHNHSYSHRSFRTLSSHMIEDELRRTDQRIAEIVGAEPEFIRPPFGSLHPSVFRYARANNRRIALWNVMPAEFHHDYSIERTRTFIGKVLSAGDIVAVHDNEKTHGRILDVIRIIIDVARKKHLTIAPLRKEFIDR